MKKEDYEISQIFQSAVDEALEAGWGEARIREEFEHALASGWDSE